MRTVLVALACLSLLAACGNEEEIGAKQAELSNVRTQLAALERELAEKSPAWQEVKDAFIEASQTLKRVLLEGDERNKAAAEQAYAQAQARNGEVSRQEWDLRGRINELKEKAEELRSAIQRLGG